MFTNYPVIVEILLIRRHKLLGLGWHWGILVRFSQPSPSHMGSYSYMKSSNVVYDLNDQGFAEISYQEFAQGLEVYECDSTSHPSELAEIMHRVRALYASGVDYNLSQQNCEHLAKYMFYGRRESEQVQFAMFGVFVGVVVLLLRKAG